MDRKSLAVHALLNQGLDEAFVEQLDGMLDDVLMNIERVNAFPIDDSVFPYMIPNRYVAEVK